MGAGIEVRLLTPELRRGAMVGIDRRLASLEIGCQEHNGHSAATAWVDDIEGALSELALAKALGIYWMGAVNTFKNLPDLGAAIEVRSSRRNDARLIVRRDDNPDANFVLVTGSAPTYRVRGWIRGRDARQPQWWHDVNERGYPAWWVPQEHLRTNWPNGRRG